MAIDVEAKPALDSGSRQTTIVLVRLGIVAALGVGSIVVPMLALPASLFAFLGWAALPGDLPKRARLVAMSAIAVAGLGATAGMARFTVSKAALGIVGGGQAATEKAAVSFLREILFAEDAMRRDAEVDPDGDHIGSALLLPALGGHAAARPGRSVGGAILQRTETSWFETRIGPAARLGAYYYVVCLPRVGGGFTARPDDPIDDELSERRYLAYAWPADEANGLSTAYFLDEHETILVRRSAASHPGATINPKRPPYFGPAGAPSCDAALTSPEEWLPWEGKKPREGLPGDPR